MVALLRHRRKVGLCDDAPLGRFLSVCADLCRGVKLKLGNWGWVCESEWYGGFGLWCWENWR